ncbi:uncharacterized protein LOC129801549 [Phlebotomus papatasi]|uniref:Uncharacterized protein n=1 Tax=Phlebotomus papatasi TaxID=29031 RepID=A0A1B0DBZ2_PHLPP|nr:uncharacterized protein LOC129801549 [Phlebotomus papatasi]
MSLVAYEYSSDEDNDSVEGERQDAESSALKEDVKSEGKPEKADEDPISDEDDEKQPSGSSTNSSIGGLIFNLPAPNKDMHKAILEEEDDEFLKIKATPIQEPPAKKGPVRITIPSLSDFKDLEDNDNESEKKKTSQKAKGSDLLSILPKPLSETLFQTSADGKKKRNALVPDSVVNRHLKKQTKQSAPKPDDNDECSDDSDTGNDFFRLNTNDDLPEVSKNEISVLVAKKAAQIAATSSRFEQESETPINTNETEELPMESISQTDMALDDTALEKLCGSGKRTKRARIEDINIVDIRGDEVMPSQEEWMRHALANSTDIPKAKPAAGTEASGLSKRKHQITYLAYQAKANEQELQAMWAANRQSRRQTQSKYGF